MARIAVFDMAEQGIESYRKLMKDRHEVHLYFHTDRELDGLESQIRNLKARGFKNIQLTAGRLKNISRYDIYIFDDVHERWNGILSKLDDDKIIITKLSSKYVGSNSEKYRFIPLEYLMYAQI